MYKKITKTWLTISLFILVNNISYSQRICKTVDEFTNEINYRFDQVLIENDDNSNLVSMYPYFRVIDGKLDFLELIINVKGIGCIEKDSEVIFIFENGEKTSLTNWNKFNCSGSMFCSLTVTATELFKTNKLSKFRITNKTNYKSATVINVKNKYFFKDIFSSLELIQEDPNKVEICKKDSH
jgi:hypothetical protein